MQMNIYENLKNNIKNLRSIYKLTQKELADKIQIPRANLARYETGENIPPLDVIVKIADYFDVTTDELFGRKGF